MLRRTFLRTGALAGLALYSEPWGLVKPTHHDWIEDRGDFVVVRVPAWKRFENEAIPKPAIFLLGCGAVVEGCTVKGYTNLFLQDESLVRGCLFDASDMAVDRDRPIAYIRGTGHSYFTHNYLRGNGACQPWVSESV